MRSNNISPFLLFFSLFLFAACGGDAPKDEAETTPEETTETQPAAITQSPFPSSPDFPDAKLEFQGYKNGQITFIVSNYDLKAQTTDATQKMCANSEDGQHIHLIIDNEPYAAKYESSFNYDISDGEHYMLAFLSRSYHESIKTDAAHVAIKGTFKNKSLESKTNIDNPMLFYSRPKGDYIGKSNTTKVLLDFYLVNTDLAPDGNKVKVAVNGEDKFVLDEWKPVFLEGLPMGDNKVKLTLIDNDGKVVATPLNPVERVFTLKADQLEE